MTRLRGSDADRRAWYEAHWRLRVDQPVVRALEVTEETLQAWADYFGGWFYFDRAAWMAAMRATAGPNDEGPPTPTAMPRTVRWCWVGPDGWGEQRTARASLSFRGPQGDA